MKNVKVRIYNTCKYEKGGAMYLDVEYKNVQGFEVKTYSVEQMCKMGFVEFDDYDEYLEITLENGKTSIFRNSYVDLFIIYHP